jgi:hypothetical protein
LFRFRHLNAPFNALQFGGSATPESVRDPNASTSMGYDAIIPAIGGCVGRWLAAKIRTRNFGATMGKPICAFFLLALSTTVSAQQFDVVLEGGQVMDPDLSEPVEPTCIIDRGRSVSPTATANLPCAAVAW